MIPEYDYVATAKEIEMIDNKIQKIKHAINVANVTQVVRYWLFRNVKSLWRSGWRASSVVLPWRIKIELA